MAFVTGDLFFIDAFQFVSSSLSNLATYLPKEKFTHTKNEFSADALNKKKKDSIPMITWMVFINSKRKSYHQK